MSTEEQTKKAENPSVSSSDVKTSSGDATTAPRRRSLRGRGPKRVGRGAGGRERVKPEFEQKIISIRRVTRVMAGGRRFSFSVVMVIGDRRGRVGVGVGKANDTSLAIQKAINDGKKELVRLQLNDQHSIPHEVSAKFNSASVTLRPNYGRGVVAGSSVRTVLELAGIKDTSGRVLSRSKNKLNNARATIDALAPFVTARGAAASKKPAVTADRASDNKKEVTPDNKE